MSAPIALFVYNRADHVERVLAALKENELACESDLTVFCDGPKSFADSRSVESTRSVVRAADGFRSVRIVEREINMGLANSIIAGVTEICAEYGRVIVLEDDLITAPCFLRFMNDALDKYQNEPLVGSIHGYWYPVSLIVPETFFLRGASCWGWATWSRAWKFFERDGSKLMADLRLRKLNNEFDLGGAKPYVRMLEDQIAGRNDSWAIRWHASAFLAGLLQLSPGRSLVRNIGFDGSGTHCDVSETYDVLLSSNAIPLAEIPIQQSEEARVALVDYYYKTRRRLHQRIIGKIRSMFSKVIN